MLAISFVNRQKCFPLTSIVSNDRLIPEMNCGQLSKILRDKFMIPAIPLNKVQGVPFSSGEIFNEIEKALQ